MLSRAIDAAAAAAIVLGGAILQLALLAAYVGIVLWLLGFQPGARGGLHG